MTAVEERTVQAPRHNRLVTIVVLGVLAAAGPLASDLYLPAFPQIAAGFGVPEARIQLTLTAMLAGMGLGQLAVGPLSDRWGRRRPLLIGSALFALSSIASMAVPSVATFVAVRFVQGIACAAIAVIARAVVRDLYDGDAAALLFSRILLVQGLAPTLGPLGGAALLAVGPWQLGFGVLAALGVAAFMAVYFGLAESLPEQVRKPLTPRALAGTVRALLTSRAFLAPALTLAFGFAMMFTYISAFSSVAQHQFGLSPQGFSVAFAANTVALIAGAQVNAALIGRVEPRRRLRGGLVAALVPIGVLGALGLAHLAILPVVLATLAMMMFSAGFVMPGAGAMALTSQPPAVAGTASALAGSLQFALGGSLAAVAGLTPSGQPTLTSMVAVMAATGIAALVTFTLLTRRASRQPSPGPADGEVR